uniref:Cell division protein n=1 Tax=Hazenia capsulata TaxID=2202518 RepID=A0A1W6EHG1_9CHLO|nr:cell division protein [Hazenia capsulata]ARK14831.1 cell division protein [Hazenia capsulata]
MLNLKKKKFLKYNLTKPTRQRFEFVWKIQNSKSPVYSATITSSKKKFKIFTVLSFRRLRFSRYCIRSNKNENQNDLVSKTSKPIFSLKPSTFTPHLKTKALGWKKSVATLYYLLIAYKKTIRVKFQYYFNNLTLLQFGIALSPFIAYLIQISLEKYELQYQKNTFLHRSLPAFVKPIPKITWDTFAYTKYSTKFNTSSINQVTSVDDCFFISLNSNWQLNQKQFWTGTFEMNVDSSLDPLVKNSPVVLKKWSFLPSRYFYQLLSESEKGNWNFCFSPKSVLNLQKVIERNSRWQLFYNDLDDIPTKFNSIFPNAPLVFQNQNVTANPPLCSHFFNQKKNFLSNSFLPSQNFSNVANSLSDLNEKQSSSLNFLTQSIKNKSFKNLNNWTYFINTLESNQKISFNDFRELEFLPETKTLSVNGLTKKDELLNELNERSSDFYLGSPKKKIQGSKLFTLGEKHGVFDFQFSILKGKKQKDFGLEMSKKIQNLKDQNSLSLSRGFIKQKILLKPNSLNKDFSELKKTDWIGLLRTISFDSLNRGQPESTFKSERLIVRNQKTWITLLTKTLNKEILNCEHPLFFDRNVQYNLFFGFSKFSKILQLSSLPLKKAVLFKPSEKFEAVLKNRLQNDFNNPLILLKKEFEPFFIKEIVPFSPLIQTLTPTFKPSEKAPKQNEQTLLLGSPVQNQKNEVLHDKSKAKVLKTEKHNSVNGNQRSNQESANSFQQSLPLINQEEPILQSQKPLSNTLKSNQTSAGFERQKLNEEEQPFLIQFSSFEKVLSRVENIENLKNYFNQSFTNQIQIALKNPETLLTFFKKTADPMVRKPIFHFSKPSHFLPLAQNFSESRKDKSDSLSPLHKVVINFFSLGNTKYQQKKDFLFREDYPTLDEKSPYISKLAENNKNFNEIGNLHKNKIFLNPFLQRKISGYLHPDTSREIILTNTHLFNVNVLNPKKTLKKSPSILNSYNEKFLTLLLPQLPLSVQKFQSQTLNNSFHNSLIQIDQPLSQNLLNSESCLAAENKKESLLLFSNLQKKMNSLNFIEPDKAFTTKKESFFGLPIRSPYGVKLEEYRRQHAKESKFYSYTKKHGNNKIQKHFLGRYDDSLNFLLQSNSVLLKEKDEAKSPFESKSHLEPGLNKGPNIFELNSDNFSLFSGNNPFLAGKQKNKTLTKQNLLTEITKTATFSNRILEKSLTFSPFNSSSFLTKKENFFDFEQQPVSYQTSFQYTKSRNVRLFNPEGNNFLAFFPFNRSNFANGKLNIGTNTQENLSLSNQKPFILGKSETLSPLPYKANARQHPKLKIANKSRVLNILYQQPNNLFKTWSIISQLGFVFIVAKLTQILQKEYIEEFLYYIAEFYAFLNEYDKSHLQIFLQGDNYRVIKNSKKKFSDLVGGKFLLTEFGDAILLLRNSRKSFYKIQISKPQLVTFSNFKKISTQLPLIKSTAFFTRKIEIINRILAQIETLPKKSRAQNRKKQVFFLRKWKNVNVKQWLKNLESLPSLFNGPISNLQGLFNEKKKKENAFVENAGFKFENLIPKGILLVGPPGCGKTLFVQALAGEASVPVIVESGQMLNTNIETNGTERLQDLFKAAREMSPCILFFDEIDTIGQKREKVLKSFTTNENENKIPNTLNRIYLQTGLLAKQNESNLFSTQNFSWRLLNPVLQFKIPKQSQFKEQTDLKTEITNQKISNEKQQNQNLVILTQLLCELDGLTPKQEIIVIGATNRPSTLDPALTRPGRFGKVIYLGLPGKQKRFELLKFYSFFASNSSFKTNISPLSPSFHSFPSLTKVKNQNANLPVVSSESKKQKQKKKFNKANAFSNFDSSALHRKEGKEITTDTNGNEIFVGVNKNSAFVSRKLKNNDSSFVNKIGVDENINWNYFANQTVGLSSAHIAAAINRSALKAIFVFISNRQKQSPLFLGLSFSQKIKNNGFVHLPGNSFFRFSKKILSKTPASSHLVRHSQQGKSKVRTFGSYLRGKVAGWYFVGSALQNSYKGEKKNFQPYEVNSISSAKTSNKKKQISKEIKLRVLLESGSEFQFILNELICNYKSKSSRFSIEKCESKKLNPNFVDPALQKKNWSTLESSFDLLLNNPTLANYKSKPLHTFETIEYGIQTISTINTGYKSHLSKGKKTNNKILGRLLDKDCFFEIEQPNVQKSFDLKKNGLNSFFSFLPFTSNRVTALAPILPFGSTLQNNVKREPLVVTSKLFPYNEKQELDTKSKRLEILKKQSKNYNCTVQIKSNLKRTLFYQKHRQYFQTLALLTGQSKILVSLVQQPRKIKVVKILLMQIIKKLSLFCIQIKNSQKKIKVKLTEIKNLFLIALTFFELNIVKRYLNRINKNHSFGFIFLFNSTCLIKNSLLMFSIQNKNHKNLNFIYYNLIFFKASNKKKTGHILLQWQNCNLLNQSSLFGDSLFINRSAYYLSGKALITFKNRIDTNLEQPIHLWSFMGAIQKRQKKNVDFKALLTKSQFEQFLVSLIAGKAGETLMLSAQFESQKKNISTIGIEELKEFGLVSKLMIENYLFYSQKELTRKQININLVENSHQIHQKEELLFLKELATLFEISNNNSLSLQTDSLKPYDQFKSFDQPWWQFKAIPLVVSLNLNYKKWYRLFVYEEQQSLRNIEWVAPDKTFHTQVNINRLVSTTRAGFYLNKKTDKYFVNRELVLKYIEFCQLNWNQLQLLESDSLSSYFLFEAFNKVFILLEKNFEFIDFLVYSLLCQETLHAFAISTYHQRFNHSVSFI